MESVARLLLFALSELRPAERLSAGASRVTAAAVLSAAAGLALAAALACLVTAGWIALIPMIGAAGAALVAALGLVVVAAILWALARSRYPHEQHHDTDSHAKPGIAGMGQTMQQLLGDDVWRQAKQLWAENKMPVLLAALVMGMALGGGSDHRDHRD